MSDASVGGGGGGTFFTLPRLLSGRKRYKRQLLEGNIDENGEDVGLCESETPSSTASATLPRRNSKSESLFVRLIRQFSSHSITSSSPTHSGYSTNNGYATLGRTRQSSSLDRHSSRKSSRHLTSQQSVSSSVPCSVSNGDIRSHNYSSGLAVVPATCGIKNHGNTCWLSAILQCLSNTDLLAEFFVMNHYKTDMMRHNKLHARKYGTRGEVTDQLASLLKALWSHQYSPEISSKFKQLVAKYGAQYEGSDQHDAQEFLLWLLDKVHEDLNIATKKKYKKFKTSIQGTQSRSDEVVAAETLANHSRCNSSFIQELFEAQLRSSLVCRSCSKHSNTFDPYLCLSLPVPTRQTHTIVVHVTYLRKSPREVKIAVSIESQATLRELRDKVSRLIKVPEKQLVLLVQDQDNGVKEITKDTEIIQELLDDMQEIYGVETPLLQNSGLVSANSLGSSGSPSSAVESPASEGNSSQLLVIVWRNRVGIGSQGTLFGPLFASQVTREASFKQIQTTLLTTMKAILKKGTDASLALAEQSTMFRLRVVGGLPGKCYLPEDVDHPLYMPTVDKALLCCENKDYRGPVNLKVILEWDLEVRESMVVPDSEIALPVLDSNIEYVKARTQKANRATLQDCFELYFREEKLADANAWMCPSCRRRQQCMKKLSLWSVPDVFIVHLKRFRQISNSQRSKLATLVLFPLSGLDMTSYLVPRKPQAPTNNNGPANGHVAHEQFTKKSHNGSTPGPIQSPNGSPPDAMWSPWQRPRLRKQSSRCEDLTSDTYDLYAVCNHHGNMQGGHYTAYCKNPVDGRWYSYDDNKVTTIGESSVITADAYILFYQRSSLSGTMSCASSATSGYSSSASSFSPAVSESHWALRLPPFNQCSPKPSRSQENISANGTAPTLAKSEIPEIRVKEKRQPLPEGPEVKPTRSRASESISRSNRAYATLPASKSAARKVNTVASPASPTKALSTEKPSKASVSESPQKITPNKATASKPNGVCVKPVDAPESQSIIATPVVVALPKSTTNVITPSTSTSQPTSQAVEESPPKSPLPSTSSPSPLTSCTHLDCNSKCRATADAIAAKEKKYWTVTSV